MPDTAFAFAAGRVPSGAATATMLLVLLLSPALLGAQTIVEKSELRKQLEGEILCTCGCRRPMNDCPMEPNCHGLDAQRAKLDTYLGRGMNRDQVLAAFAQDYGSQDILARPIDKGFNRLAWLFPYLVGACGAVVAMMVARRWSKHAPAVESAAAPPQDDRELRTRLDHELRDLD
jgi:cytochrome c-type biogenesis protein CcmH/NrfF